MRVVRSGEVAGQPGTTFTGPVELRRLVAMQREDGAAVSLVRFEDGARTNWHEHAGEQVLYILEGEGRVGTESEQHFVSPGDVVHAAPGERHWHGAAPGKSMTHISITTGGAATWYGPPDE